jgi:ribosomal protein L12E/L44/L45/RPP1/RPP2
MRIDDVDRVLDEINDQTDQMRQIQDAMGQPIGAAADIDEDELLGELEVGWAWQDRNAVRQECWQLLAARHRRPACGSLQLLMWAQAAVVRDAKVGISSLLLRLFLQELEAAQMDETMLSEAAPAPAHRVPAGALPAMPAAPTAARAQPAAAAKTPEELELEALQAEMAS